MADGLLNKASIILTPTGYKAGTLYNVAPVVEPYEDFDFVRASVASRVNSSGLVEMVGRSLGSELVTNGDFATDSDWTLGTGWSIEDGLVKGDGASFDYVAQSISGISGKTIKVTFEIKDWVSGTFRVLPADRADGLDERYSGNGTYQVIYTSNLDLFRFQQQAFDGSIDNISVKEIIDTNNIPRISYDSNGDNGHILLEPTSTNLVPYSEDFEQWALVNGTILPNATASPSGEINADKFTFISGYAQLRYTLTVASSTQYSASFYVKNLDATNVEYRVYDVTNGTDILSSSYYSQISNTEWTRVSFEFNTSATTSSIYFYPIAGSYSGSLYIWGVQLEALSYATSYIPTLTGSQEERATETATGAGSADLINSTEGVLYAEIADITNDNLSDNNIISISKSTDEDFRVHIALKTNGTIQGFIREGAGNTKLDVSSTTVLPSTSFFKVAVLFESGNNKLYVNGLQIGSTNTSTFSNLQLNSLQFNRGDDDKIFYGKCKALAVFNEALSDSELTQLTS